MILYPRFHVYRLYTEQSQQCNICNEDMNIHDLEVENIVNEKLICVCCLTEKKKLVSNCDEKESIIDMNLRPLYKFMPSTSKSSNFDDEFRFSNKSFLVTTNFDYVEEANEQEEMEHEIDPEEKIKSSWYHRARLGDENREIYDDGQDTDFEAVEEYWNQIHEEEAFNEENDYDCNPQLVFDYK